MSDNKYVPEYPSGTNIDPDIKAFITHYYTVVDTQGKHVEYSECWADDGVLILPNKAELRGREALRNLHLGLWTSAPKRVHKPRKVYTFGDNANELVIVGSVEHWYADGSHTDKDMVGLAKLQRTSGTNKVEIASLQVWLTG